MNWPTWLNWVLATAAGTAIGLGISPIIAHSIGGAVNFDEDMLFGVAAAFFLGILTGSMQWLVLRKHIPRAGWWILASLAGYVAALVLSSASNALRLDLAGRAPYEGLLMTAVGASLGVPQYWVLRQHFSKAGWWVLASSLGMLGLLLGGWRPAHNNAELVLLGLTAGAIMGGITGIALVWLLRSARSIRLAYG